MSGPRQGTDRISGRRSPVVAILAALGAGAVLAIAFLLGPAAGGSEPSVTGWVMVAFGLGWALMAVLTIRFSGQPQEWTAVPGAALGVTGLVLVVLQPGSVAMDVISWVWPAALAVLAVWMVAQVRAHLRGRGRWLVLPPIAVLLLFAIGGGLVSVTSALTPSTSTATGRLVDVGDHSLYLECTGSGAPVVVLQSGLGESSFYWGRIAPTVAAETTVCAYDRAGRGRSESAPTPQDGEAIATDLHALLEGAGVPGPFVLVAHSSGGPYVDVFAARYPDEVAGLVLLDAQPAEAFSVLPDYPSFYQGYRLVTTLYPSLARIGIAGLIAGATSDGLTGRAQENAAQSTVRYNRSVRDEVAALPAALRQASALTSIGDRPLVVLAAGIGNQTGWLEAQEHMASLSSDSVFRTVATATHQSLVTGVDATLSSQAILDVVVSSRTASPLR